MQTMNSLTFAHLETQARAHGARAREPQTTSWLALADLIRGLAGDAHGQDEGLVSESQPWWLESLTLSGFRGISEEVTCRFEASPGLTVIHGSNGTGKSSLCHALDLTLHQDDNGSISPPAPGRGGRAPLWDPVLPFGGFASPPAARVVLKRSGQQGRVELTWGTHTSARTVTLNGTLLEGAQLGSWKSALTHRLPVYSYADWERRLSTAKDMQTYLASLLAFGGLFALIDDKLDALAAACAEGTKVLSDAWDALDAEVRRVRDTFAYESPVEVPPWPTLGDIGATEAAVEREFSAQRNLAVAFAPGPILALRTEFANLTEGLNRLDREAMQHQSLGEALATIVNMDSIDPDHCPVCGKQGDWQSDLQLRLQTSSQGRAALTNWAAALQALLPEVNKVLTLSPALVLSGHPLSELGAALDRLRTAGASRRPLDDETVEAVRGVNAELATADFESRLGEVSEATRRVATARGDLRSAFTTFVKAWREHGDDLDTDGRVKAMRDRLRALERSCSNERAREMTEITGPLVAGFLADAGITLGGSERSTASGVDEPAEGHRRAPYRPWRRHRRA